MDNRINKETLKNRILWKCGRRTPVETRTEILKWAINTWAETIQMQIKRMLDVYLSEYSILDNVNIYTKELETRNLLNTKDITDYKENTRDNYATKSGNNTIDETSSNDETAKETRNLNINDDGSDRLSSEITMTEDTSTDTTRTDDLSTTNNNTHTNGLKTEITVSAYDSETYAPKELTQQSGDDIDKGTGTQTGTVSEDASGTKDSLTEQNDTLTRVNQRTDTGTIDNIKNISGNKNETQKTNEENIENTKQHLSEIGSESGSNTGTIDDIKETKGRDGRFMLQEQLLKEIEIAMFNIYDWIVDEFDRNFMLQKF